MSNLDMFARGCAVLGAGGAGETEIGVLLAREAIRRYGPVPVLPLETLAADDFVMPCGMIGAPTIGVERIWNGDEGETLRDALQSRFGRPVRALMCYDIAGANGLLPLVWAARMRLPIIDADGMGRAFPEMQQQVMHLASVPASPVVLTDGRSNTITVDAVDNVASERLARAAAAAFGGLCAGALYTMAASQAATATIGGSLSLALRIGKAMDCRVDRRLDALANEVDGTVLVVGKIIEVDRRASGGFVQGAATIEGATPADERRSVRLELQNEVLLALEDGELVACVPDVISLIDGDTGEPLATERLRYGQRVGVVAFPGPKIWRTEAGLAVVGPRAFGYDVDYRPCNGSDR